MEVLALFPKQKMAVKEEKKQCQRTMILIC